MNNKKGFTLIELIVTIVILGLVLLVSVPIYNNMTGKTKQKLYNTKIKTIKLAAANFAEDYKNEIKSASSSICIPIETLIKEGKLISDVKDALFLMNPNPEGIEKQQYLSGQVEVKYENDDLVTDYVIGGICPLTINPGLELENRYEIDMTPPSGKLTINDGNYTNKNQVTLKLDVDEDTDTFCYSNTNVGKCIIKRPIKDYNKDIIPYTFPDAKEELKHIYVWLEDKYGNVSSPLHGTITYDKTNPTGSLLINGGNKYTNNKSGEVTLTLNQEDNLSGVDKMCVKNDTIKCSESEWENYAESKTWTLTPNDGEKTISVWYRDRAMNESQMYSKNIFLDRVDPSDGSIAINGGNPYTNNREVTLTLSSTDPSPASGVTHMCISETSICTTIIKYETSITRTISTPNDGTKTYYVYYIDAAGNKSKPVNDTIILDETPPVCVLTGGNAAWTNGTREIKATCSDDGSGCSSTMPSYTYKTEINTTTAGAGGNNVGGTIYDKAGNPIECTPNQTVKIDKTDPTCVSSGGNASWTNGSRTLTGTCSDTGGSECTGNATLIMDQEINTTTASPGTVYDKAGNSVACPANQTVKIDKTDPTCASSGGNSAWTNTSRTLTGTCLDTGGSECVGNITKTINTETNTTTGSPGTVYDNAGNSVSCPANQTVKIDKTKPTGTIKINNGASSTASTSVTISLTYSDNDSGISQMCISNSSNSCSSWVAAKATYAHTLTAGDGEKTVYVTFKDKAGNLSKIYSSTINLDTEPDMLLAIGYGETNYFWGYREKITEVNLQGSISIPSNAYKYWDVSKKKNKSIMAYIIDDGKGQGTYKLYIQGKNKIYANYNSSYLFYKFEKLTKINNLQLLDTSLTYYMIWMFAYSESLTSLDLSNFNTSRVISMSAMFCYCRNLKSLNLSSFNTSNVEDMSDMFNICDSLTSLNVRNFDTSNVTDMSWMFSRTSLENIYIDNFDTSNVTNMAYMFYECPATKNLYMRNFDFSKANKYDEMFELYYYGANIYVKNQEAKNFVQARLNEHNINATVIIG